MPLPQGEHTIHYVKVENMPWPRLEEEVEELVVPLEEDVE